MSSYLEGDRSGRNYSTSEGEKTVRGHDLVHGLDQLNSNPGQGSKGGQGLGQRYHGSKAWWSVGEFLHQGLTHKSVGLSLGHNEEETWDLSDSLADLYQAVTQRQQNEPTRQKVHNRSGSSGESGGRGGRVDGDRSVNMKRWLDDDTNNGFIRVYTSEDEASARLFPCTLSTSSQKICLQLGIPGNSLHVQMNGNVIRRMDPFDCPLAIQNEFLDGLGYADVKYIQEEGLKQDLAYLIRFYAGKPLSDSTYSRNQLQAYLYVRKGKLLHQWTRRWCVISGTRLLIYRDKGTEPTVLQLAKGSVEEVQIKGQPFVLKVTSTYQGEKAVYLSFISQEELNKWMRKIRKATVKLPSKADLSNCHLEFIPENVFINTELQILILRHNALRERPIDEDIYTIGWLDDLPRFIFLRSLNLADNQLMAFPLSLCSLQSVMELNLASNKLEEIPPQICELVNLQVLHLHNNLLNSLPDEIARMTSLTVIVLAFNRFLKIPPVLLQGQHATFKLDSIIMAGNEICRLPADHLVHMSHIKKVDLRLNKLQLLPTETAKFHSLEHITHMDIRENDVVDLDIRAIRCLEYLNCKHNNLKSLQVNGASLRNLFASHNYLQTFVVSPKPEWIVKLNISHNKLTELPNWLPDCFFLVHLDVRHNQLTALPDRLFTDAKRLKILKANHNRLTSLPEKIRTDTLEELHLQHNFIRQLSVELFIKAHRLRYLNMTRNKLCDLPPPNRNDSYNKLQELYLSFNHLNNSCLHKICCFPRLRVLHLAKNKLSAIKETDIEKLEQLMELNVSFNNLTYLPAVLGRHPKLQVLRANCNLLQELPKFKNSSGIKVLEVSSNHLVNVNMGNLMASQISLLDISANPNILVNSHDIGVAKNKKLCMLDMRGQNLSLEDVRLHADLGEEPLWQTGLSQTSGIRNKLSVTAINKPHFSNNGEALFAIFDGGRNDAVSNTLCDVIPAVLREERARNKNPYVYIKYCFLSAHRNLKTQGQKLGAAAAVAHLYREKNGQHILSVGNVGDVQVVLCRQKRAYLLSRRFVTSDDVEDKQRVVQSGGIITEDGRVSGVTYNTRLLGCSYLHPQVIPEPYVTSTILTLDDTFFIVASHGLWHYITYEEAIREIMDIPDPVVAAKRLQDLAQGYGSRENISVLVVRLMLTESEKSRIKELMIVQRSAQKELIKVLNCQEDLLQFRDGVPKSEELTGVIINKSGHARKNVISRKHHLLDTKSSEGLMSAEITDRADVHDVSPHWEKKFPLQDVVSMDNLKSHKKLRKEKSDGESVHKTENINRNKVQLPFDSISENSRKLADSFRYQDKRHSFNIKSKDNSKENVEYGRTPGVVLPQVPIIDNLKHYYEDDQNVVQEEVSEDDEDIFVPSEEQDDDVIHTKGNSTVYSPDHAGEKDSEKSDKQNDFYNRISSNEDFNVSPSESVSSIDVRVHNEDNQMYKLCYISSEMERKFNETKAHLNDTKMNVSAFTESGQFNQNEEYTRSLSPESVISQDEFVKPPVNFANIDRDAVLFHAMQLARAQAQASSNASLDSIQSAPLRSSSKDVFSQGRTLSRSIEVLVNFGENGAYRGLSDSLNGGRVVLGSSSLGVNMGRESTVVSNHTTNVDSERDNKSYNLKNFQKVVKADVHDLTTSEKNIRGAFLSEKINDENVNYNDMNDSDNDTLVGDAEDLAHLGDVDFNDQESNLSGGRIFHDASTLSGHSNTEASDSDSDESLGNVSLEDGYSAVEFSRVDRQGSLSMMNVLESEYEEYPEHYQGNKYVQNKYRLPYSGSHLVTSFKSDSVYNKKLTVNKHQDENNHYETIDVGEIQATSAIPVNEYLDDVNPYEDVQSFPQEHYAERNIVTVSPLRQANVSSEEDIDMLYAKINKIKMDKLKVKFEREEVMGSHLKTFLPIFLSETDQTREHTPAENSSHKTASAAASGGKEKKIFSSASDVFPVTHSTARSSSNSISSASGASIRDYHQAKQFTKTPLLPQKLSPHSTLKCNIPEADTDRAVILSRSSPQSLDNTSIKSFKFSATTLVTGTAPQFYRNPAQQPSSLPQKPPYSTTQDVRHSSSSTRSNISPKPMSSQTPAQTLSNLSSDQPLTQLTSLLSPVHHTSRQASTIVQPQYRTHSSEKPVSSGNERYPNSHQPSLLTHPSTSMTEAASKLSSQKSISITYL